MDTQAMNKAYADLGVFLEGLNTQKSEITGDKSIVGNQASTIVTSTIQEITMSEQVQNTTHEIPAVARKTEATAVQAESKVRFVQGPTLLNRAAERSVDGFVLGTFAVGAGAALMALSKIILAPESPIKK